MISTQVRDLAVSVAVLFPTLLNCGGDTTGGRPPNGATAGLDTAALAVFGHDATDPLFGVVGALLLDSAVVIGEESSGTLRFYGLDGTLQRTVGGKGEGPGEFGRLFWIQAAGGSIFAYDLHLSRLSEFSHDGAFLRSVKFEPVEPFTFPLPVGVFDDGSILARAIVPREVERSPGIVRQDIVLLRFDRTGAYVDSLGRYQGTETYKEPWGRMGMLQIPLVFGRESGVEARGSRYYVIQNNDRAIDMFDTAGAPLHSLNGGEAQEALPVTQQDVEIARRNLLSNETPELQLGPVFDRMPKPDSYPVYGWDGARELALSTIASNGDVWVLNHGGIRDDRPVWTVFDAEGSHKNDVLGFEEMSVLDANGEVALTLRWDENDVERVELRRILWR